MIAPTRDSAKYLRTPETRFTGLPDFDFAPRYAEVFEDFEGIRVHYVDEPGETAGDDVFLCLHGNPSWCYLYRKMIPVLRAAGRVVAPDLIGFGRSDKPVDEGWHTFERHRSMLLGLVRSLDLRRITLVVQDWGGVLGLTLPLDEPDRFARLIAMNTGLATGASPGEGFEAWRTYSNSQSDLDVGQLLRRGNPDMTDAEADAYNAPFPDVRYKAAVRAFPDLVPRMPDALGADLGRRALQWWRDRWQGPSFVAVGVRDPVLGVPQMEALRRVIRGCPPLMRVEEGGHFVQEWGAEIARRALEHFAREG